jgi:hypothetical protein
MCNEVELLETSCVYYIQHKLKKNESIIKCKQLKLFILMWVYFLLKTRKMCCVSHWSNIRQGVPVLRLIWQRSQYLG